MDDGVVSDGVVSDEVASPTGPLAGERPPLSDRLWVPALAAFALALAFVGVLLVRADGDPSLLVHAGPPWATADGARGSLTIQEADEAFDGQFFYRLGVAPWSEEPREGGVTMDLPALRNARWGYGALAFVASGGDPDLVPWALIGLNLVAVSAVGALGGLLARGVGRPAIWGLSLALWPGFAYSLSLDTSELVASAFLLGGLVLTRRRQWPFAGLAFAAAVITRDTTAVVPFGLVVASIWLWWDHRRRHGAAIEELRDQATPGGTLSYLVTTGDPRAERDLRVGLFVAGFAPLVDFVVWQIVQRIRFGELPLTSSGDNNLTAPLGGLARQLGHVVPPSGGTEAFRLLAIGFLVALLVVAAACWRTSQTPLHERIAWIPAVGVVLLLNAYLWSGATAFLRASTEAGLLSILVVLGSAHRRVVALTMAGVGAMWVLTAIGQVGKLG